MSREEEVIKIIDENYNQLFTVPNGGKLNIDGKEYTVTYLDPTHFRIGGRCFHVREFSQTVISRGATVEPVA